MEVTEYGKSYSEYKAEMDREVSRTAEGFVRIGYLLKVARDTGVLYESPYDNVVDFAQAEYGIDKTQVSRFISINDRFSEGGYSDELQGRYKGYGVAKLAIMLQLPDAVNEVLSPSYSKAEIQMVKDEVDAERAVTDLELMMEAQEEGDGGAAWGTGSPKHGINTGNVDGGDSREQDGADNTEVGGQAQEEDNPKPDRPQDEANRLLHRAVWQLGRDEPDVYREIHHVAANGWQQGALQEALAPDGERTYSIRIAGVGRILLTQKEQEGSVALVNVRTGAKQMYQWGDMAGAWGAVVDASLPVAKSWGAAYGGEMPEPQEKDTATAKAENPKTDKTKGKKTAKAAKVVRVTKPKQKKGQEERKQGAKGQGKEKGSERQERVAQAAGEQGTVETDAREDNPEQIQGQMEAGDYPELLPETGRKTKKAGEKQGETEQNVPEGQKMHGKTEQETETTSPEVAPVQPQGGKTVKEKCREAYLHQLGESLRELYGAASKGMWAQTERIRKEIDKKLAEIKKLEP